MIVCADGFQSRAQGFDSKRRRMLLARRQGSERACDLLFREPRGIYCQHPFYHLCEHGAASERRRTTVSEKARGFNTAITHTY